MYSAENGTQACKLDMIVFVYPTPAHYLSALAVETMTWAGNGGGRHTEWEDAVVEWATVALQMLTHPSAGLGETALGPAVLNRATGRLAQLQVGEPGSWAAL